MQKNNILIVSPSLKPLPSTFVPKASLPVYFSLFCFKLALFLFISTSVKAEVDLKKSLHTNSSLNFQKDQTSPVESKIAESITGLSEKAHEVPSTFITDKAPAELLSHASGIEKSSLSPSLTADSSSKSTSAINEPKALPRPRSMETGDEVTLP